MLRFTADTLAITRCLVVDDDPELLHSVCDYLRRFGLEAVAASTAAQMRSWRVLEVLAAMRRA